MTTVQTNGADAQSHYRFSPNDRRDFIGGSDGRVIMGDDQDKLTRLWQEKRGEVAPEDLSDNLIVQLGTITEVLNRAWYQRSTGQTISDIQKWGRHPVHKWMAATLDGMVEQTGAVFEAKFMLPWAFTEEAAAEKHMAQLQHNMWVVAARSSVLSIITGGGKWVEIKIHADPLLSASAPHRREEVLALRSERRCASALQYRNAATKAGGR
ncbi:putative phage-related endonuclease [Bradyrhizobium sp. GM6.1]